jgi:subtilisin inhibitor-like
MAAKRLIGRTFLAAATLAGTALVPALADAEPASTAARSMMNLSVRGEQRGDPLRTAVLTCEPAGGSHPHANDACETLKAVNGDIGKLAGAHTVCPMVLKPVTLTARGSWQGQPVSFEKKYSNECVAEAETGKVFSF